MENLIYHSIADIYKISDKDKLSFWQVVLKREAYEQGISEEEVFSKMRRLYLVMKEADKNYDGKLRSESGMSGGDGLKFEQYDNSRSLFSPFSNKVCERALKMGENNACMKRIVAAPTAGSCGVIPAIMITAEECLNLSEDDIVKALFVAAGIGNVIAENASISGARGGCQAEIGSASAMAAGALFFLKMKLEKRNSNNNEIADIEIANEKLSKEDLFRADFLKELGIGNAVAFALSNMLGLTCDPVGGLVEVPCIKRNASGAVNAILAAELASAGIKSVISADDVIDSMRRIGDSMHPELKETAMGGLATTESAQKALKNKG